MSKNWIWSPKNKLAGVSLLAWAVLSGSKDIEKAKVGRGMKLMLMVRKEGGGEVFLPVGDAFQKALFIGLVGVSSLACAALTGSKDTGGVDGNNPRPSPKNWGDK